MPAFDYVAVDAAGRDDDHVRAIRAVAKDRTGLRWSDLSLPARRGIGRLARWLCRRLCQRLVQSLCQRLHTVAGPVQRVDHHVAQALAARVRIQQAAGRQGPQQRGVALWRHAAQLHVGAAGQLQHARAMHLCQPRQPQCLVQRQPAQRRAHAHHQPVARGHGLPGAGAPALDVRGGVHAVGRSRACAQAGA